MGKIVYLPLDERPCNEKYPRLLAEIGGLTLISPSTALLGDKKKPADAHVIADWLLTETRDANALIISVDMLVYGGIVPSRLHYLTEKECAERINLLRQCKAAHPQLRIYAFNLIMRTPAYNSSEEEPDYYLVHGADLHRYGWLLDKNTSEGLDSSEQTQWDGLQENIPSNILLDFMQRRERNASVNEMAVELAREGIIDQLIIPLDDNARYGFTSIEQRKLKFAVEAGRLMDRVLIYPGADEIGCTLLARVFCEEKTYVPEVFVRYSSTQGPFIIPRYEDRSLNESIKSHLTAAGAFICDSSAEADVVLMVNSPPVNQSDAAEANQTYAERHRSYFSEVHLPEFSQAIHTYARKGKFVALADVATSNGADESLMQLLFGNGGLSCLSAYAGWNTSGNTLGTVIAHAVIASYYTSHPLEYSTVQIRKSEKFLLYRFLEDWGYQSNVRTGINLELQESAHIVNERSSSQISEITFQISERLKAFFDTYLAGTTTVPTRVNNVMLPWKRTFEVNFDLTDL